MFVITLSYILLPSDIATVIVLKLSSSKIISAVSFVTSVPLLPIPIPTLASFIAGASFTPSPVIATTLPIFWKDSTICNLFSGLTLANTEYFFIYLINSFWLSPSSSVAFIHSSSLLHIPTSLAIEVAVVKLSPVNIIGLILALKQSLIDSLILSRTGSFNPINPSNIKLFSSSLYLSSSMFVLSITLYANAITLSPKLAIKLSISRCISFTSLFILVTLPSIKTELHLFNIAPKLPFV